ncbi:MAG: hypothetical protein HY313_00050 [Acidobacteria bacterium]|nr:hypothetical protein [Acidobacteriota bacterium]
MPTKSRRENTFIERFLAAYANGSWADAKIDWLDMRTDGAVEALATRKSDGKTLAIEHTIIEPFVGDKKDVAFFDGVFRGIEEDVSLLVPGKWRYSFQSGLCLLATHRLCETQLPMESIAGSSRISFHLAMALQNIVARSL